MLRCCGVMLIVQLLRPLNIEETTEEGSNCWTVRHCCVYAAEGREIGNIGLGIDCWKFCKWSLYIEWALTRCRSCQNLWHSLLLYSCGSLIKIYIYTHICGGGCWAGVSVDSQNLVQYQQWISQYGHLPLLFRSLSHPTPRAPYHLHVYSALTRMW